MWAAIGDRARCIATARVAKHRLFVWFDARVCPDCQLIVIARDDDTTFGILHSRFHELWSLRLGTSLDATLDVAVAAGYGWPANISEDDALHELLKLNNETA